MACKAQYHSRGFAFYRGILRSIKNTFPEARKPPLPTAYPRMILENEDVDLLKNILAAAFSWILLAGYLVFPNTLTSLQTSDSLRSSAGKSGIGEITYKLVLNIPLLTIAGVVCLIGLCGHIWLWKTNPNFLWLKSKIFLYVEGGCERKLG